MKQQPLVSVIINNYNYAHYLRQAVDSALAQAYSRLEVIVVDDGSTDESARIMRSYGNRVRCILKENGGQASALNTGFKVSRGDIVIFLDSDDCLYPSAVPRIVAQFLADDSLVKVHYRLHLMDEAGEQLAGTIPTRASRLSRGDKRSQTLRSGPWELVTSPTTGNAWSRRFLEQAMPIPERTYFRSADMYLNMTSPFFGPIGAIDEPLGRYRIHTRNLHKQKGFGHHWLRIQSRRLAAHSAELGYFLERQRIHAIDPGWFWPYLDTVTLASAKLDGLESATADVTVRSALRRCIRSTWASHTMSIAMKITVILYMTAIAAFPRATAWKLAEWWHLPDERPALLRKFL